MRRRFARVYFCLLLAFLLSLPLCACSLMRNAGHDLSVYFFSAGKADAILLRTENASVLIDCGERGFGQTILDELEAQGISRLDYLIVTHFDQDHVGGAARIINKLPIGAVLQSSCPRDSEEYEKYVKALSKAGLEPVTVREDTVFTLDGVTFSVNPPLLTDYKKDDSNNSSLIVTVNTGSHTLLLMGDAQTERLAEYLSGSPADCDLIKIPHHGGEDELMDELIAATSPAWAVITCARDEPDISATQKVLDSAGVQSFLTSEAPVRVVCSGESLSVGYAS